MASKVCTKCNVLKRIEEYTIDRSKPMGYKSSCKECFLTARRLTPEKNRKWALNWSRKNKERKAIVGRAWRSKNAAKLNIYRANRRARLMSSETLNISPEDWSHVLETWHYHCAYCLFPQELLPGVLTIDHVVPLSRGGLHDIKNVVPACRSCNASKGAKLVSEWLEFLELRGTV